MKKQNDTKTTLNILSLEDSERDFELISELLIDEGYNLKMDRVEKEQEFVAALRNQKYDIILADFNLPEYDTFAALKKSIEISPGIPFMVVSGNIGDETAIELIKQGAVDYILKDNPVRLPSSIKRALEEAKEKKARMLSEERLRESEAKFRGLFSKSNVGFVLVGLDKSIIGCNLAFCNFIGYTENELREKTVNEIAYPEDKEIGMNELRRIIEAKIDSALIQKRYLRKDGVVVWGELSVSLVRNDDNKPLYFATVIQEITDRKQTEESLLKSQKFNESLLQTVPFGMDIVDEGGNVLFMSENLKKIFGTEVKTKKCWELYRDDKTQCQVCPLHKGIEIGETDLYETHDVMGGKTFEISHTGMIFEGKKAMLEIFQDITERKQADETLRHREMQYRDLFEEAPVGFHEINKEGRIMRVNHTELKMLGYKEEEMLDHIVSDFLFDSKPGIERVKLKIEGVSPVGKEFEVLYRKKDGSSIPVAINDNLIVDSNGNNTGIRSSMQDITNRKRAELELIQAKEKAEESDQLKTAFLNNISHEVRTPMNAIVGFSEFLSDPNLPLLDRQNFNEIIVQSSKQLLSIITDIVSIATIEVGQEKIYEKDTKLNVICNLLNEQYILKANNQNVDLCLKNILPDNEVLIKTDEAKLTEILSILINNALKFTKEGDVNFGYCLKDNHLEFYVEDSGIGIPSELHEVIFKRFRQAEITSTRQYGGSGLGLSIAKAYVELLGGKIWLESESGKGSVFYFTIPYKKVKQDLVFDEQSIGKIESKKLKTILVAEDEIFNFMFIEAILSESNFIITRATNGIEAVEICKTNPDVDLVLMDVKMPEMDGYEATKLIKEFRPDLPIIAQTAYTAESDIKNALACGCSDFISKPFKKESLLVKINGQLQ